MAPRWTNVINAIEAARLYRRLKSWEKVGIKLAKKEGRRSPYKGYSVQRAVYLYKNRKRDFLPGY